MQERLRKLGCVSLSVWSWLWLLLVWSVPDCRPGLWEQEVWHHYPDIQECGNVGLLVSTAGAKQSVRAIRMDTTDTVTHYHLCRVRVTDFTPVWKNASRPHSCLVNSFIWLNFGCSTKQNYAKQCINQSHISKCTFLRDCCNVKQMLCKTTLKH